MGKPMPESALTLCQSQLIPLPGTLDLASGNVYSSMGIGQITVNALSWSCNTVVRSPRPPFSFINKKSAETLTEMKQSPFAFGPSLVLAFCNEINPHNKEMVWSIVIRNDYHKTDDEAFEIHERICAFFITSWPAFSINFMTCQFNESRQ
jgi:hypothetical protein